MKLLLQIKFIVMFYKVQASTPKNLGLYFTTLMPGIDSN